MVSSPARQPPVSSPPPSKASPPRPRRRASPTSPARPSSTQSNNNIAAIAVVSSSQATGAGLPPLPSTQLTRRQLHNGIQLVLRLGISPRQVDDPSTRSHYNTLT